MESKIYKVNVINHTKINDHIEYVLSIENIQKGNNFSFTERYTILRNLYELMKKEAASKNFPPFPPSKLFGYEEEKFVVKREKELNTFFESINADEKFSKLPSFINYIELNLKKNPNKEKISSKKIQYSIKSKSNKIDFEPFLKAKRLTPEEFKKKCLEGKKIAEAYNQKFVNLDYDIEINAKEKDEIKYNNLISESQILREDDNNNLNQIEKGKDDIFNLIGNLDKGNEIVNLTENKIKNIINQNIEKFSNMSKMIDFDEFLLK